MGGLRISTVGCRLEVVWKVSRKWLTGLVYVGLLVVAMVAGALGVAAWLDRPPDTRPHSAAGIAVTHNGSLRVEIKNGETIAATGHRLEAAGIIRSHYWWDAYARLNRRNLKAGLYDLPSGLRASTLYARFADGRQALLRLTIPEGLTISKTAALVEHAGLCNASAFIVACRDSALLHRFGVPSASMEGFLYPDTYLFAQNSSAETIVATMANATIRAIHNLGGTGLSQEAVYHAVILASIVEREYRAADEAPLIAGVFLNRLRRGMRLESCATVEYVLTEVEGHPHPERLYYRDLAVDSPYNTYTHTGLPPAPIASPGKVALNAALHPANTNYLFFRLTDAAAGRHTFSKTFDAHIHARPLYLKSSKWNGS
jgi:UPF0755 protein